MERFADWLDENLAVKTVLCATICVALVVGVLWAESYLNRRDRNSWQPTYE
jgi:hypothetical protein